MRTVRSRTLPAAITACALLLVFAAESYPSYDTEAGRKYDVARQRVVDLKKSKKRQRYRSYWMDCVRTFELVEKKYPKSPSAGDACLDRAGLYLDLYGISKYSRDKDQALKVYATCQTSYPRHTRAPEALFHAVEIHLDYNKDPASANKVYAELAKDYPGSDWTNRAKVRLGISAKAQKRPPEFRKPPKTEVRSAAKTPEKQPIDPSSIGTVNGIRQWSSDAYTRIVIDLDKPLKKFESNELRNPDRLVFDLSGVRMGETLSKDPLVLNNGILRQVRSSQFDPSTVRVVLDLASIKSYAAFPLHDPDRLVIDVTGEETPAPAGANKPAPAIAQAHEAPHVKADPPVTKPPPEIPAGGKISISRQLGLKVRTIAIDAGHGGRDPGAIGKNGLKEKTVTLDIAKRLAKLVRDRLGCEVIMTRDRDVFIDLDKRPFIAKSKDADLFVSIHVNATRKRLTRGIETYIQSFRPSDRDAMATAAMENATTSKTLSQLDNELEKILKGLANQNKELESVELANYVQNSLVDTMRPVTGHVVNFGVKKAFFYVLVNTNMPSILAEVGFVSNPEDEKLLRQDSYKQKIAEALFQGVNKFVESRGQQMAGI